MVRRTMAFRTCSAVTFLGRKQMRGYFAPRAGALPTGGIFVYGFSDMAWPRLAGQREKESKDGGEDEGRWQPEADPRTAFN